MFNIEKFKFVKTDDFKDGLSKGQDGIYQRDFGTKFRVQLMICGNMFTLSYINRPNGEDSFKRDVACRYIVETQEQLDFLILKGRVGWYFEKEPIFND